MRDISNSVDIIEKYICSKTGDDSKNEDGLFINENFISVIDGATSKSDRLYSGKTGGQILKDSIIQTLSELRGDENYIDAIRAIQYNIIKVKDELNIDHAAASAVIFSRYCKQLWLIGDCQARIGARTIRPRNKVDALLSEARSFAIAALLKQGYSVEQLQKNDLGRESILPFLKMQKVFENSDGKYGYYVLNTDPSPIDPEVITKVYQVRSGDEVILASDGYPELKDTLEQSEQYLFDLIKRDPLLYEYYPTTKGLMNGNVSFDDRTYIRFIVK